MRSWRLIAIALFLLSMGLENATRCAAQKMQTMRESWHANAQVGLQQVQWRFPGSIPKTHIAASLGISTPEWKSRVSSYAMANYHRGVYSFIRAIKDRDDSGNLLGTCECTNSSIVDFGAFGVGLQMRIVKESSSWDLQLYSQVEIITLLSATSTTEGTWLDTNGIAINRAPIRATNSRAMLLDRGVSAWNWRIENGMQGGRVFGNRWSWWLRIGVGLYTRGWTLLSSNTNNQGYETRGMIGASFRL